MNPQKPSWIVRLLTRLRDSRLLWDGMGSIYNRHIYGAVSELYERIAREMKLSGHAYVLDVGAGRGYISLLLASRNPRAMIAGIDYSPMQVHEAERHRRKQKIANCSFRRGNAMHIAFQDAKFDAAVSVGSIKHWPDGVRGLREIHRVLKPGGYLMISETDQDASDDALRSFIRRFRIWFIPDALLFWGLRNVIFGQSYSEQTLFAALRAAGFRAVESQRVPDCPYTLVKALK
ncbi:MAG: class I SAM-dependent methyltransferase [Smithellaceae bacterium]|nr:class I SAM-dependent methyltransferase [Syntrophaceae bacterium]MDD4242320.1 class I SAM-dependent methyltransferase [Smithellaceae bacterium]NLX52709.1 class I SAM-dependent methyltransferase [Deltaproteobacteria bacterium]